VHLTIEDCRLEIGLPHVLISKQNSNCFASFHSYEQRLCSKKSKNKMLRYCLIMQKESCWILVSVMIELSYGTVAIDAS
jgi:hypothetical protein